MPATFDPLASRYDADFSDRPTARVLRGLVHDRLRRHVGAGDRVLELGGGTGVDAAFLAGLGAHVTLTDPSAEMRRTASARTGGRVQVAALDVNALPPTGFDAGYRLVLANFGALNACRDFGALAAWLAVRVPVGGRVCMAVMSRFCLWEAAWGALRLKPRLMTRRWGGAAPFTPVGGAPMTVIYPSVGQVERAFAPWFVPEVRRGLGVCLPPSELFGVVERRPRWLARLTAWEQALWARGWGVRLADHIWWEMVRRN
jgi:SAM-dependent methyltransferase